MTLPKPDSSARASASAPARQSRSRLRSLLVLVWVSAVLVGVGATTAAATTPQSEPSVVAYQRVLSTAGFYRGEIDGLAGPQTRAAVLAFQKAAGLETDGIWRPLYFRYLRNFEPNLPARSGEPNRLEIDLTNQVGYLIANNQVAAIFGVSSGSGKIYQHPRGYKARAVTPQGDFTLYRHYEGLRHSVLGFLYRPWYFRGGFALHGSGSVPAYPASHGCIRVTNWDIDWLSERLYIGMPIHVWSGSKITPATLHYERPDWPAPGLRPT
jgi:lipoprotein-anchoring transpeptidase ErfK/SrfK